MTENYIQYAGGYQKDSIDETDIEKAISDIQLMDNEHGAFGISFITNDEDVIEVNKDLLLSVIFEGAETRYQATNRDEVKKLYHFLLLEKFNEIKVMTK